jgi:hypothetical protein
MTEQDRKYINLLKVAFTQAIVTTAMGNIYHATLCKGMFTQAIKQFILLLLLATVMQQDKNTYFGNGVLHNQSCAKYYLLRH